MKERGFTLVELVAIVAILAVIFAISFPKIQGLTSKTKDGSFEAIEKSLCDSGKEYMYQNITYYSNVNTPGATLRVNVSTLISDGFIKDDMINPKTNSVINSGILNYTVKSNGALDCTYEE